MNAKLASLNVPTISDHYSVDHDRLDDLFAQFVSLKSSDRAKAVQCFHQFKTGLEQHIVWEEEILFPSFERKFGHLAGPTHAMRHEHHEIQVFLTALAEKLADNDFSTELEEFGLQAVLCPHNHKEEGILYPIIDQTTGNEERSQIFNAMKQKSQLTLNPTN